MNDRISYLSAQSAKGIDVALMGEEIGYSVDQLMELAGLSVAEMIKCHYGDEKQKVLVVSGPGNNGGDGLVAARHLTEFGYKVCVYYPKPTDNALYTRLLRQLSNYNISILESQQPVFREFDVIVDAVFGFSFKGKPRDPFKDVLQGMYGSGIPVVAVDIPSGWDVDAGPTDHCKWMPDSIVSLTLPKQGVKEFKGVHFVGGRFVPKLLKERYQLTLPIYAGTKQSVRVT